MGQRASYDPQSEARAKWIELRDRIDSYLNNPEVEPYFLTETSARVFLLAIGALMVSYHKYGAMAAVYPEGTCAIGEAHKIDPAIFSQLGSFGKRLRLYFFGDKNPDFGEPGEPEYLIEPGNAEYLVDAINFLTIEFMHPANPNARYQATDRWGSPGRVSKLGVIAGESNQLSNADIMAFAEDRAA